MIDINDALARLDWQREPLGLYAPIGYTLEAGGKRLRPTLALIAADMYGGDEEQAVSAALALEIFHNYTLLHDDVMDQAPVRRGRPTVHVQWNDNTAILSGDQMMIEAYRQLEGLRPEILPEALRLFNQMATNIICGQQYDMDFEQREDVRIDEYMEMIRLKTSVLLGDALRLGALTAGAPEEDREALYRLGESLGLAFQIQDDVLDVWGDEKTFGKRIGGDIVQNKKSLVMLLALQHADEAQLAELREWLHRETFVEEEKIGAVTALYNAIGVRALCEQEIERYTRKALEELTHLPLSDEKKEPLRRIAEKLLNRKN